MRLHIKRFNETLFTLFKQYSEIIEKFFLNNNNKTMEIIIKGHYQEKSSFSSEKPDIIRVLGPDQNKEGNWITQDGKSIPEYVLQENYILLNTSTTETPITKVPMSIFDGFEEVSLEEIEHNPINKYSSKNFNSIPTNNILPANSEHLQQVIPIIQQKEEPKISFDISVIDKINIDTLNKKSQEKLGINKYVKPTIIIELPIVFDYQISKLKHTIELLELDENIIIDNLISKISIDQIKILLKKEIKKLLEEPEQTKKIEQPIKIPVTIIEEPQIIVEVPKVIVPEESRIIIDPILEKGISEIEEYLTNNFKS